MTELAWIAEARKFIGLRENTGKNDHPKLDAGWVLYGEAWLKGQAWCGLFVKHCLHVTGRYTVPLWFRAKSWENNNMTKLDRPAYGCIAVISRQGGNHVMFVVGVDRRGNIMCLGGNQSNAVTIAPFSKERMNGATYWWPSLIKNGKTIKSVPATDRYNLPLLDSNGKVSTNEA